MSKIIDIKSMSIDNNYFIFNTNKNINPWTKFLTRT